jgi:hypothetical protein
LVALASLDAFAHDGADQGFLTSRYPNMEEAPLFDVRKFPASAGASGGEDEIQSSDEPLMRMSTIWNFNQVYEIYKCNMYVLA